MDEIKQIGHLIQFKSNRDYEKAIVALLSVPFPRCGFPERRMLVMTEHLAALDEQQVPYVNLTAEMRQESNGKK